MKYYILVRMSKRIDILKALADPTRLDIVRKILASEAATAGSEAATCSSLSQPAMSHHFSKLVAAGVLQCNKQGIHKYYRVDTAKLEAIGIDIVRFVK